MTHFDPQTTLRRASLTDFDAVLAVVHDATRRVQEKGYPSWKFYLTAEGIQRVRAYVARDDGAEVYLLERNGAAIGAFALTWRDPKCWGTLGDDGRAGYVHMLSLHRSAKGQQLGERMMAWAEGEIARRGCEFCRLDCWRGASFLVAYYPRLGYSVVSVVDGVESLMNFQKRVRTDDANSF